MEKKIITENGENVYYYPLEHLHTFNLSLYIKAGVMYEQLNENGISHLLEHVIFRNINYIMSGKLYEILDENALQFNATTYKEFILLEITGPSSRFSIAYDILSHAFDELILPMKEIVIEKKRVKAEINEDKDTSSTSYHLQRMVWKGSTLDKTILGNCKIVNSISRKKLNDLRSKSINSKNSFFYITGCVSESDIQNFIMIFNKLHVCSNEIERTNIAPVPDGFFNRSGKILFKSAGFYYIKVGFDIDNNMYSKIIRDYIYSVLFENESSSFYQELSEKTGLIYSYDARLEEYINISNITVEFEVRKNNFESAINILVDVLNDLKVNCRNLDKLKSTFLLNFDMEYDNITDLNWAMGYNCHILNQGYHSISERKKLYENITADEICSAASDIFRTNNMSMVIKGNLNTTKIAESIMQRLNN